MDLFEPEERSKAAEAFGVPVGVGASDARVVEASNGADVGGLEVFEGIDPVDECGGGEGAAGDFEVDSFAGLHAPKWGAAGAGEARLDGLGPREHFADEISADDGDVKQGGTLPGGWWVVVSQ